MLRRFQVPFALIITAVLLAAIESLVGWCGVTPSAYREDTYVGFASRLPLFVHEPQPDGAGRMVTAENKREHFNLQSFTATKPPDGFRIFCLGGSVTYGRPYGDGTSFCGWLRAMLPRADGSRQWELVNVGGISYANYRLAAVMEELAGYQPDLFIIYTGHNEFLEQRTYQRLAETPWVLRELKSRLVQTRTFTALERLVDPNIGRPDAAHRRNDLLPVEVQATLDNTIGPALYHRDEKFQRQVVKHFEFNLGRMIDIAASAGAQVILVTPASNLRDCSPFKSEHRGGLSESQQVSWESYFQQAGEAYRSGDWTASLAALDRAVAIDDRYAQLHYERGRVLWKLNRFEEARAAFVRARDEDICPLRALTSIGQAVRRAASQRDVPLVDFDGHIERQSPHGTAGEESFLDHVHPPIEGHRQLALLLMQKMERMRVVQPGNDWNDESVEVVRNELEQGVDRRAHGVGLRKLARVFDWSGKFAEAHRLSLRAIEQVPDDAESYALAGSTASRLGRNAEAARFLERAVDLDPAHLPARNDLAVLMAMQRQYGPAIDHLRQTLEVAPDSQKTLHNLGKVLIMQSRVRRDAALLQEAVSCFQQLLDRAPDHALSHYYLGVALEGLGRRGEALSHFKTTVRLQPDFEPARAKLKGK